jgi:type 1 glutamine amidotransferase
MLESLGVEPTIVDHPDKLAGVLDGKDLLVIHGCFFQMLDDRYTPEQRNQYSYLSTPELRDGIAGWVQSGRPILAMHTAVLCFDDWEEWPAIAGAGWDWSRSHHPPIGDLDVRPADNPLTVGLNAFTVTDERYTDLALNDGVEVLATATSDGLEQPAVWMHQAGPSKVLYNALGHDERSLGHPDHRALMSMLVDLLR